MLPINGPQHAQAFCQSIPGFTACAVCTGCLSHQTGGEAIPGARGGGGGGGIGRRGGHLLRVRVRLIQERAKKRTSTLAFTPTWLVTTHTGAANCEHACRRTTAHHAEWPPDDTAMIFEALRNSRLNWCQCPAKGHWEGVAVRGSQHSRQGTPSSPLPFRHLINCGGRAHKNVTLEEGPKSNRRTKKMRGHGGGGTSRFETRGPQ